MPLIAILLAGLAASLIGFGQVETGAVTVALGCNPADVVIGCPVNSPQRRPH